MNKSTLQEWKEIEIFLKIFYRASGMMVNMTKSTFDYSGLQGEDLENFKVAFPFNFVELFEGFRYLGYFLKTISYNVEY